MFSIHHDGQAREELTLDLDEIARAGARRMLAHALEAEVDVYIEAAKDQRDENGHALVVRNGHAKEREILCGTGAVKVKASRVIQECDRATLHASLAEGYGGVASALPAWAFDRGLHPGIGGVFRHGSWPVGCDYHPPGPRVARGAQAVHGPLSFRAGVRLRVGRRRPHWGKARKR